MTRDRLGAGRVASRIWASQSWKDWARRRSASSITLSQNNTVSWACDIGYVDVQGIVDVVM